MARRDSPIAFKLSGAATGSSEGVWRRTRRPSASGFDGVPDLEPVADPLPCFGLEAPRRGVDVCEAAREAEGERPSRGLTDGDEEGEVSGEGVEDVCALAAA